jgi:hypothetical protein
MHFHVQIMNAYICLMNSQKNLLQRTDGSIILENTFTSEILKIDGINKEQLIDEFYLKMDNSNNRVMEKRVSSYLETDMVC